MGIVDIGIAAVKIYKNMYFIISMTKKSVLVVRGGGDE